VIEERDVPGQIVDACCLINLYASGSPLAILRAWDGGLFVSDLVRGESLFVRREDDVDKTLLVPEAIDLTRAVADGLLQECQLASEIEAEHFIRFAAVLDDGEALCLALAKCRDWVVATDDRKAIRVATDENIATITIGRIPAARRTRPWRRSSGESNATLASALEKARRSTRGGNDCARPRAGSSVVAPKRLVALVAEFGGADGHADPHRQPKAERHDGQAKLLQVRNRLDVERDVLIAMLAEVSRFFGRAKGSHGRDPLYELVEWRPKPPR
jgi:hypothetical protein